MTFAFAVSDAFTVVVADSAIGDADDDADDLLLLLPMFLPS